MKPYNFSPRRMGETGPRKCAVCGTPFEPLARNHTYCSPKCKQHVWLEARAAKKRKEAS